MSEPDPKSAPPVAANAEAEDEDVARVRAAIGEGLRNFYESVAAEPIPEEWLKLVGAPPERKQP